MQLDAALKQEKDARVPAEDHASANAPFDSPRRFFAAQPGYLPTPLVSLPALAQQLGVECVYVKDESQRPLGSFKYLGGVYAGLRALVRASSCVNVDSLLSRRGELRLPLLLCASDGNHGLAVAHAARLAGTTARVYLPSHVPPARAARIESRGAEVMRVSGTYDEAVDAAHVAALAGAGLLIADTSADSGDPVVLDVMEGYCLSGQEILEQLHDRRWPLSTHLFLQAGVGGWAAALARTLAPGGCMSLTPSREQEQGSDFDIASCQVVVVEPQAVACVTAALRLGRIERLAGDLATAAEMLSCGEASAPAIEILRACRAVGIEVDEESVVAAPEVLQRMGGPSTTPSGATGLAGLQACLADESWRRRLQLGPQSRVLLTVTEGPVVQHED